MGGKEGGKKGEGEKGRKGEREKGRRKFRFLLAFKNVFIHFCTLHIGLDYAYYYF